VGWHRDGSGLMVHDAISRRLRQAREARGMTQAEVARAAHLEPSAVAHFESGRREPSARNLRALCRAVDVSADYLLALTGTDDKTR
jgi:transcriptional regulator with XRE-family HTH domain